jgi:hypothetical protein
LWNSRSWRVIDTLLGLPAILEENLLAFLDERLLAAHLTDSFLGLLQLDLPSLTVLLGKTLRHLDRFFVLFGPFPASGYLMWLKACVPRGGNIRRKNLNLTRLDAKRGIAVGFVRAIQIE